MRPDLHALAARLPDLPRSVETRWLLRSAGARFHADADDPDSGVVIGAVVPLGSVIGCPAAATIQAALAPLTADFELIVQVDAIRMVAVALPSWQGVQALIHTRREASGPAGEDGPQVQVCAPPDERVLDRLWEEARRWAEPAEAIAVVSVAGVPVSLCQATAVTERWWDVGVETLPEHRRRGYARACFRALDRLMQQRQRRPVWGAEVGNEASLRLADALGFRSVDQLWVLAPDNEPAMP